MMKTVYLGGTISPAKEHLEWRRQVKVWALGMKGDPVHPIYTPEPRCRVIDPTDRNDMRNVTKDGLHDETMPDSLFVRADLADIERADVVMVVYWPELHSTLVCPHCFVSNSREIDDAPCPSHRFRRQSIGTWAEFGMAAYLGKPIIVVSDDPSVTEHPFVRVLAAGVYGTLEEGLKALEVLVR